MKHLLTIAALTLLTSTAWAINAEGDTYTDEGDHGNIEHSHRIHHSNNQLNDEGNAYTGEGTDVGQIMAHSSFHKHPEHTIDPQGNNEPAGS